MLKAALVHSHEELAQIHELNQKNLKQYLSTKEREQEGFVTWPYSVELLQSMHRLAPSVVVKEEDKVIGYALTLLRQASSFHPDLDAMFRDLQSLHYKGSPLFSYSFYCMGQICIDKSYRGKGVFTMLYQLHKEVYRSRYDLLITEIAVSNIRSLKAHEKTGFETIYTYGDALDEWKVVVWDWH